MTDNSGCLCLVPCFRRRRRKSTLRRFWICCLVAKRSSFPWTPLGRRNPTSSTLGFQEISRASVPRRLKHQKVHFYACMQHNTEKEKGLTRGSESPRIAGYVIREYDGSHTRLARTALPHQQHLRNTPMVKTQILTITYYRLSNAKTTFFFIFRA